MPPTLKSGAESLTSRQVRAATVGTILLWAWFMCFFFFPRIEVLFAALHVDQQGPSLPHLIFTFRAAFKTLYLSAALVAIWIVRRKNGVHATNLLAGLLLFLLIETGVVMYAAFFMPLGGLSRSIH
jgi:hypothetical protein